MFSFKLLKKEVHVIMKLAELLSQNLSEFILGVKPISFLCMGQTLFCF